LLSSSIAARVTHQLALVCSALGEVRRGDAQNEPVFVETSDGNLLSILITVITVTAIIKITDSVILSI